MQVTTIHQGPELSVYGFRCTAGPRDRPYAEVHRSHSLSYVRSGSFGCRALGRQHELVVGAVMVGRPGQEYMATHEHHDCGDECLSVKLSPGLAESLGAGVDLRYAETRALSCRNSGAKSAPLGQTSVRSSG